MALTYIARASLEVNGNLTEDIKSVEVDARKIFEPVKLMYKTGEVQITQRYSGKFTYVVPAINPLSFDTLANGTLTVVYENGSNDVFGGVYVSEIGAKKVDGEKEITQEIKWIAETRNGNFGNNTTPV